jgi:hypothetical protein
MDGGRAGKPDPKQNERSEQQSADRRRNGLRQSDGPGRNRNGIHTSISSAQDDDFGRAAKAVYTLN